MLLRRVFFVVALCFVSSAFAQNEEEQSIEISPRSGLVSEVIYQDSVDTIYAGINTNLAWSDPLDSAELESQLSLIHLAGLSEFFSHRLALLQKLRVQSDWEKYDIIATDTLLNYQIYSLYAPEEGFEWYYGEGISLPQVTPETNSVEQIIERINTNTLSEYIVELSGEPNQMRQVHHAMAKLIRAKELNIKQYTQNGVKRLGDTLEDKPTLLARLESLGLENNGMETDSTTFDNALVGQIKKFQRMHGIKDDGIIGKNTLKWINYPIEQRLHSLALNTERSRLLPKDLDNTVIVNLPSFHLNYWYHGQRAFSSKVIVGTKKRPTPLLQVRMDTLIVNPSWNAPRKLVREDIIPHIKQDPTYLERMNMKILKNWRTKEEIDPSTIDWATLNPKSFPYNITQGPGERNSLGAYKFNTPNNRAIYLHDTPAKYLFNNDYRAYSSGCIRVEHANKFAELLLANQGMTLPEQAPDEELKVKKIGLRQRIPVHILYQTAWIQNDLVQYREDIYGHDTRKFDFALTKN